MGKLHLIANPKSGKGGGESIPDMALRICAELRHELIEYKTSENETLDQVAERAVLAAEEDRGVVVAAGGDGTIRSVAQHACRRNVRFAAIPCGTFNFFARAHKVPEDFEQALRVAINGQVKAVRLGEINGKVFLINASLGLYATAIRDREKRTSRWGRNRFVVILSTVFSFFQGHKRYLNVALTTKQETSHIRTPMVFIGNNALQLRDLELDIARCMKQDLLAVVTLKPIGLWGLFRILFLGLFKLLEREESIESFCVDSLKIEMRHKQKTVALDGELFTMSSPLQIKSWPEGLQLMVPKVGAPA